VRALICALGLLAVAGEARADGPYMLPPVGTELTYRLVTTSKPGGVTAGQIYTYVVAAVDGPVMEATIKPVGMILGCPAGDSRIECQTAMKAPGMTRSGDLVTVPVPDDIGAALAKESALTSHYFMAEDRKYPMPGPRNANDPDGSEFGMQPAFVMTTKLACDYDRLADFVPIGKTPHLALPCHSIFSRTQSRVGNDVNTDEAVSLEVSYAGAGKASVPAGDWDVQKVGLKFVPADSNQASAQSELEVANKLGLTVRTHVHVDIPRTHGTVETDIVLIAIKP
jgi:hypothetical protein